MIRWSASGVGIGLMLAAGLAHADPECRFEPRGRTLVLQSDCSTSRGIPIPHGFTLNGNGFWITAVDPPGGHFRGAIVYNAGTRARVRNVRLRAAGLADHCDGGADALRGILFDGASGSVEQSVVLDLNQGQSGCQEGHAIEVRNAGPEQRRVTIHRNVVERYQKTGIVASGQVRVWISDNVVTGLGPVAHIAQNGIQIGWGATGTVRRNAVSDNAFSGAGTVATGILVVGGEGHVCERMPCALSRGARLEGNVVVDNDIGIALDNRHRDGVPALQITGNSVLSSTVVNGAMTNGSAVQIGILGIGNRDRIRGNTVSGDGYDPAQNPGAAVEPILAEPPYSVATEVTDNQLP